MRKVLFGLAFLAACGGGGGGDDAGSGAPVTVTGRAFVFGGNPNNLPLEGALVAMVEAPSHVTSVGADGTFSFTVPSGVTASFSLVQDGFHPNQSATLAIGAGGIPMLGFQTPTEDSFQTFATIAGIVPDPAMCQIATTISRAGTEPYGGDALGEEGATAAIDPPLDASHGPVYFAYNDNMPFPDTTLSATSIDGGVAFTNVPPGDYTLTAQKAGVTFTPVAITCRAGVLVNAAPPHGLQE
ncbi:MAG TPA: hypothetical protein VGM88_33765 [Kofleriaceae bacterium]|jgi:hypothetical protein